MKENMNYKEAWNHIYENNLTDDQRELVTASPEGRASATLALAAERLAEASQAAHGKGAGAERQLFERLADENPL